MLRPTGAKEGTGQALSRLLNLTDDLLGQGLDAVAWLGTAEGIGPDGATLAELHALCSTLGPIDGWAGPTKVGQYL